MIAYRHRTCLSPLVAWAGQGEPDIGRQAAWLVWDDAAAAWLPMPGMLRGSVARLPCCDCGRQVTVHPQFMVAARVDHTRDV